MGICFRVPWPLVVNSGRTLVQEPPVWWHRGTGRDSRTRFPAASDLPVDLAFLERSSQASFRQNLREGLVLEGKRIRLQSRHSAERRTASSPCIPLAGTSRLCTDNTLRRSVAHFILDCPPDLTAKERAVDYGFPSFSKLKTHHLTHFCCLYHTYLKGLCAIVAPLRSHSFVLL